MEAKETGALLLVDDQGGIVGWSHDCTILWGRSERAARLQGASALFAGQEWPLVAAEARDSRAVTRELTLCRADGSSLRARCTVSAYPAPPSCLYAIAVHAQACEADARLPTAAHFMLEELIDGLPGLFYIIDKRARLLRWNRRVVGAFQIDERSMQGIDVMQFINTVDRPVVLAKMAEAFERGNSSHEAVIIGAMGKRTPYLFSCTATTLGGQRCLFGTALDITERKRQEARLLIMERAMDACIDAILITRREGSGNLIEYVNPSFSRMTGYSRDECIGRDPAFMRAGDLDADERARIRQAVARNAPVHALLRNVHKNGQLFWNDLRISPVVNAGGQVTHAVAVIQDVTETLRIQEQLRHLATHDQLTGLGNRSILNDALTAAIERCRRDDSVLALAYVDLDNFKCVNDTLGHEAGDQVLMETAERLRSAVRAGDTLVRLGGDEFVAVLCGCKSIDQVAELVNRLQALLAAEMTVAGKQIAPLASIGVGVFPHDGNDARTILRSADAAMYRAKAAGKNSCRFYSEDMDLSIHEYLERERHLRQAIDRNELFLQFQPKIDLQSNEIVGAEALVRWNHPSDGVIMPNDFIGLAEESGSIIPLGRWVLDHACASLQALRAAGFPHFTMSINLSARQLRQPDFLAAVQSVLLQYDVAEGALEFEVTESQLMDNPEQAARTLEALKKLGLLLSIDDFGTGYSSLGYLQRFPVDYIKIDRSFLAGLEGSGNAVIAQAIISLGHNLNMCVVAEGVETSAQLDFLREHRCDLMQGHYFSAALSQTALVDLLRADSRMH